LAEGKSAAKSKKRDGDDPVAKKKKIPSTEKRKRERLNRPEKGENEWKGGGGKK